MARQIGGHPFTSINIDLIEKGSEQSIASAARTCYDSFKNGHINVDADEDVNIQYAFDQDAKLIRSLITRGHHSMLRFTTATIRIKGCSRPFTHEIVRHQVGLAFAQRSQHYLRETEPWFVIPESIYNLKEAKEIYIRGCLKDWEDYKALLDLGIVKGDARYKLPEGTATEIVIIGNLQAWRYIVQLRGTKKNIAEMNYVMCGAATLLKKAFPIVFNDIDIINQEVVQI